MNRLRAPQRPPSRRGRARGLFGTDPPWVLFAAVVAALVGSVLVREPARVEGLRVVNPLPWDFQVLVSDGAGGGWVELSTAERGTERSTVDVLDQGARWRFRLRTQGVEAATFDLGRGALAADGWTVTVPAEVADRLRAAGVPESPS